MHNNSPKPESSQLLDAVLARLEKVKGPDAQGWYTSLCPLHPEKDPSFRVREKGYRCFGCDAHGSLVNLASKLGIEIRGESAPTTDTGVTLEELARARGLDVDFLMAQGWSTTHHRGRAEVLIPYPDQEGNIVSVRRRLALTRKKRFVWRKGDKPLPYGLQFLPKARELGYIIIEEGETDCAALNQRGIPALGMPGATAWRSDWKPYLEGIGKVYAWQEPGRSGTTFIRKLAPDIPELLAIEAPPEGKDPAELAALLGDGFPSRFRKLMDAAQPVPEPRSTAGELLVGSGYTIVDDRLCFVKTTQDGEVSVALSNFTAQVVEEVARDDGDQVTKHFAIEGKLARGPTLPQVVVPAGSFGSMAWVAEAWGIEAIINAGVAAKDRLRVAIQILSHHATKRTVYTHTGWREVGGRPVFLTGSGALGGEAINVELEAGLDRYVLPLQPQNIGAAMEASLRFLEVGPPAVAYPLWAEMYLGPLAEWLNPNFSTWVVGRTGTFKSTVSALALCHFGEFDYRSLPAAWTATTNYLEKMLFVGKDVPVVIDDLFPQESAQKGRELDNKASVIDRAQANRTGRGRLRSDTTVRRTYIPRGVVISTAEQLPSGESHLARVFAVEIVDGVIDREKLTQCQGEAHLYPHAMAGYILWLAEHYEERRQQAVEIWRAARDRARREAQHPKLPEAVAHLYTAWHLPMDFAVVQGVMGAQEADTLKTLGWNIFLHLAEEQGKLVAEQRPTRRYFDILRTLFAQGKVHLKGREGEVPPDAQGVGWVTHTNESTGFATSSLAPNSELIGWADEESLYLLPEAVYNRVSRFCRDEGFIFPIRETTLRRHLAHEGFLMHENGRNTQRICVEGQHSRVLQIQRPALLGEGEEAEKVDSKNGN